MNRRDIFLTIGGSDPSAGAGIQADLKTFQVMGEYGASVVTSITSQNTSGFSGRYDLPPAIIQSQIQAIVEDMTIAAVKIGMVGSGAAIRTIAGELSTIEAPVFLDPVILSTTGGQLLDRDSIDLLKEELVSIAYLVIPNAKEAEILTGRSGADAARELSRLGAANVIITGGDTEGTDLLLDEEGNLSLIGEGLEVVEGNFHGTGCTYTSSIAVNIVRGMNLLDAAESAKRFVMEGIIDAYPVGYGLIPVNQSARLIRTSNRYLVIEDVKNAVCRLLDQRITRLLPEVGSNLAVAIPNAKGKEDVAAVRGRIVKCGNAAVQVGPVEFGASDHIARIVLSMMRFDPDMRACCNIRYSDEIIDVASSIEFLSGSFSREDEPEGVNTMDWGVTSVIKECGCIPDLIYDKGGIGKEAMIRVTGKSGTEVTSKIIKLLEAL